MSECTHDCSSCSSNCSSRKQDFREPGNPLSNVKKVIGVVSGKGGVGKSTITSLLSVLSNRKGFKTAILDADITGPSIPKAFGLTDRAEAMDEKNILPVRTKTGIKVMSINLLLEDATQPVIWRGPVLAGAVKQFWTDTIWHDIDYMPTTIRDEYAKHNYHPRFCDMRAMAVGTIIITPILYIFGGLVFIILFLIKYWLNRRKKVEKGV